MHGYTGLCVRSAAVSVKAMTPDVPLVIGDVQARGRGAHHRTAEKHAVHVVRDADVLEQEAQRACRSGCGSCLSA